VILLVWGSSLRYTKAKVHCLPGPMRCLDYLVHCSSYLYQPDEPFAAKRMSLRYLNISYNLLGNLSGSTIANNGVSILVLICIRYNSVDDEVKLNSMGKVKPICGIR
jgi:hypothetical protein